MKWAVVTGASRGIGKAITQKLSQSGWNLVLVSRSCMDLKKISESLDTENFFISADLQNPKELQHVVDSLNIRLKSSALHALINNAGVFQRLPFDETSDTFWEECFNINLMAPVRLTRLLKPLLKASASGSVVNIGSTLGQKPVSHTSAYAALKAALWNWTQSLALEWAPEIRVNCVSPGIVDTSLHPLFKEKEGSEIRIQAHALQPLQRLGKPEDIASAVSFLLSEEADWITGTDFTVDGGIHLV